MAKKTADDSKPNGVAIPNDKLLHVPIPEQPENDNNEEETQPTADVVVPIDGGWGWVIVVASFMCTLIVDGIVMNASTVSQEIAIDLKITVSEAAFISSLLSGFYLIAGPFASAMANRWGFRPVTIAGSLIGAVAFVISSYVTSAVYMCITFGLIGGFGFSLIYIPAVITVGYYFERWRAVATGIALCGSGVGTFAINEFNKYFIANYGWRQTLQAQAALILVCAISGLTFRPLKSVQVTITEEDAAGESEKKQLPVVFTKPLAEGRYAFSVPSSSHNTWIGAQSNTRYPTAAEVFRGSGANLDRRTSITPSATPTVTSSGQLSAGNIHHTTKKLEQLSKAQQKRSMSGSATPEEVIPAPAFNIHKELNTVGEDDENESENLIDQDDKQPQMTARRHTVSGRRPNIQVGTKKEVKRAHALGGNRPLYRDDIFFSGSLLRIPQYQSQTSLGYHMSVTRMPTAEDVVEDEQTSCRVCPEAVRRTLATMLDMSLLKSPSFMLLAVSGFLTMMGFFVPFCYMKARAIEGGMAKGPASFAISVIGIANTLARIVCGVLSSIKGIDANVLSNVTITLGGIFTIFSGLYASSTIYQYTYAVAFGITIACFSALRSIIAVDLMGIEKLTNAFGILMLFQGLAAIIGAPIAGMLYEKTSDYDYSFYFAGVLITISAFLCYPLSIVNKWEKARALETSKVSPMA